MARPDKEQEVLQVFEDSEKSLTIPEVKDKAGTTHKTARKHVLNLVEKDRLEIEREIGQIKLYKLKE